MTLGWILEKDWESFFANTERVKSPGGRPTPYFPCPFCDAKWAGTRELRAHVASVHSVARPVLLIDNLEPPRICPLRTRPKAFSAINATGIELQINGASPFALVPNQLSQRLAALDQAEVSIRLINASQARIAPVVTTYDVSFRIAGPAILRGVEMAFSKQLASSELTRGLIGTFLQDRRCVSAGRDYAAGLAHFALGVLLKERPSGEALTLPFSVYRDSYGAALEVLGDFDRPLARLIAAVIRFAFNDFTTSKTTGFWDLDLLRAMLSDPECDDLPPAPAASASRVVICPVDHGTGQILDLGVRMFSQPRWSPILDDECRRVATSTVLDEMDRQKALAVWAIASWRLGAKVSAEEPLRQISAIHPFRTWAEPLLESLTP